MRITHKANILRHLQQGKTITQREAISLCNCYRLSAVIFELRCTGYIIKTHDEDNDSGIGIHARYELIGG